MRLPFLFSVLIATTSVAVAQGIHETVVDIEVPTLVFDSSAELATTSQDEQLDLANIVQSAAKGVTTVQEAPAITTVFTADELRDRQFQDILQVADTVPGWQRVGWLHSMFPTVTVRGQVQAVQFLHDGLSLFDPMVNMPTITRVQPMELIKRVEMITGPGGVLWGSNSLLGIMNITTKDAEDVDGVEAGSSIGHGVGDRLMARAYVMAGAPHLLGGKLKVFGHGSVETFQGAAFKMPLLLFHQPLPQPNSSNTYGPLTTSDQMQSMIVNLSGKASIGKLQLRAQVPFARTYRPLGLSGNPNVRSLAEDARCVDNGTVDPKCIDNLRATRKNAWDGYDRYLVAEYRDQSAGGKANVAVRGYAQEFVRGLVPLQVLAPSSTIQGGLTFNAEMITYRVGGALDGDVEIARPLRVLYGAEAFTEWLPDTSGRSIQGAGNAATFTGPYLPERLPLPCPRTYDADGIVPVAGCPLTFAYESNRSVFGAYLNPQLRPSKKLILDAGARVQVAPEQLGTVGYDAHHGCQHLGVELHAELAPKAQLRAGVSSAGVQQHVGKW